MNTIVRELWHMECNDCRLASGPYEYRAPAHSERVLHEFLTNHHVTVFMRLPTVGWRQVPK